MMATTVDGTLDHRRMSFFFFVYVFLGELHAGMVDASAARSRTTSYACLVEV